MLLGRAWQFGEAGLRTSSLNNLYVLLKPILKICHSELDENTKKGAEMPGEQASIREEGFTFPLTISGFRGIRISRNDSRNAER